MGSITKRKTAAGDTRYKATVRPYGRPASSKTFSTLATAKAWMKDVERDIESRQYNPKASARRSTVGDAIRLHMREKVCTENPDGSIDPLMKSWKDSRNRLRRWERSIGNTRLDRLTADMVYATLTGWGVQGQTWTNYLQALRSAIKTVKMAPHSWVSHNPTDDVPRQPAGKRERVMTQEEYAALLRTATDMRLNQVPKSGLDDTWLSATTIEKMVQPFDDDDLKDCPLRVLGLDIGGGYDLESIVLVGIDDGGRMLVKQWSFVSADGASRLRQAGEPVDDFIRRGELTVIGESSVPIDMIAAEVADIAHVYDLDAVIADITMTSIIVAALEDTGLEILAGRQGSMSMAPVMFWAENVAGDGKILIGDDTLLKWTFGNTAQLANSTGRRPVKRGRDDTSNTRKIDPISAYLTALQLALDQEANTGKYDTDAETLNPWEDPVDALAVLEGGVAAYALTFSEMPRYGNAFILRNNQ